MIIIAIAIAGGLGIFSFLIAIDASSASQLQFTAVENEDIDFLSLSMDSTYAVCNPTGFSTSFDKIYAQMSYKGDEIADITIWGKTIPAGKAVDVDGRIDVNGQTIFSMAIGAFVGGLAGQTQEFDERGIAIDLKVEKSLLGVIPFTYEKKMTGGNLDEIQTFFTSDVSDWGCDYSPKQQTLAESSFAEWKQEKLYEAERAELGETGSYTLEEALEIQRERIESNDQAYNVFEAENLNTFTPNPKVIYEEKNGFLIGKLDYQILSVVEPPTMVWNDEVVKISGMYWSNYNNNPITNYGIFLQDNLRKDIHMVRTDSGGNFEFSLEAGKHFDPNHIEQKFFVRVGNDISIPFKIQIIDRP